MLTRLLLIYPLPQAASPPPKHRSSRHPGTVVCRAGGGHSPPGRGRGPHTAVGIGITRGLVRTHPHRAPLRGSGEVPELMCAVGEVGTGKEHVLEKHWPSWDRLCCPRSESECPVPSTARTPHSQPDVCAGGAAKASPTSTCPGLLPGRVLLKHL